MFSQSADTLRAKVTEERRLLEELRGKFNQPSMKEAVDGALVYVEDAEAALETGPLGIAEVALMIAIPRRQQLQKNFADYGTNAVLVGG